MALVQGLNDEAEVQAQLKAYFRSLNPRRDYAAPYVSQVFVDESSKGVAILEQFLFDRKYPFRDRALQPLLELPVLSKGVFGQYYAALGTLTAYSPTDEHVRALLFNPARQADGFLDNLLIQHFPRPLLMP